MIIEWFENLAPAWQALMATCFTWFLTALGAGAVFIFKSVNKRVLDGMLGFAAGVMIAASYWSLLAPAIEMAEESSLPAWVPATAGFLLGGAFLWMVDKVLPHLHIGYPVEEAEGLKTTWRRSVLLVLAITLHNVPEGLAVGVAFGALGADLKSFWYGQLSGTVEPIAGVLGAASVILVEPILPYALAFAAGAMIFVVVEELIPESQLETGTDVATVGAMLGFATMMTLDVALG
jgi:ZIP family zinc transporter